MAKTATVCVARLLFACLFMIAAVAGCGSDKTPEQRLRNAGFTAHGAPNYLTVFGTPAVDHGVFLRKGPLTVSVVVFEKTPDGVASGTTEVLVGRTLLSLHAPRPSADLRRRFAEAVRIARGDD